jgi:hypothetical protein
MSDRRHPEVDGGNVIDFLAVRRRRLAEADEASPAPRLPVFNPYPGTSDSPAVRATWDIAVSIWSIR